MKPDDDISTEPLTRIVCAAIRHKESGLIIAGARHYDPIMTGVLFTLGYSLENKPTGFTTGFITNKGEYLDREQAWIVAEAASQIRHRVSTEGTLYSECLF